MELTVKVFKDEYTDYVENTFDLKVREQSCTHVPDFNLKRLPEKWNVGVICGASGSGKSTILKSLSGGGNLPTVF